MPRRTAALEFTIGHRPNGPGVSRWLHQEIRRAIIDGKLKAGTRLPSSRDLSLQHRLSRGTVVAVFEELEAEGFIASHKGAGTWVSALPKRVQRVKQSAPAVVRLPFPFVGLRFPQPGKPFRSFEPALDEFPISIWTKLISKYLRHVTTSTLAFRDGKGFPELRRSLVDYLSVSRGVNCHADQIVILTGVQQALDVLARVLLRPRESVWVEDPGYFGAVTAFRNAGAHVVPVMVDREGLSVSHGKEVAPRARAIYLTPSHQFPLGMTMSLRRRLEVLNWAQTTGAFIIEDDYDGAYRLAGSPVSALQSLDRNGSVVLVGGFNKMLFPSLRIGYVVLPERLVDAVSAYRFGVDQNTVGIEQAVLAQFIDQGHLARHIRRTRDLYAERLHTLKGLGDRYLRGVLDIEGTNAGLYTLGILTNGMQARRAEALALERDVETVALDRFCHKAKAPKGLMLGFAAFDRHSMEDGFQRLAAGLSAGSR